MSCMENSNKTEQSPCKKHNLVVLNETEKSVDAASNFICFPIKNYTLW